MGINIENTMRKYNLRPAKALGQNFLVNQGILRDIVKAAELTEEDTVLEIGPGLGNLTAELAERAGLVVAVEIDKRLLPILKENLKDYENIRIINADILQIDPAKELAGIGGSSSGKGDGSLGKGGIAEGDGSLGKGDGSPVCLKIVANLPYYITTPVIMKLLESGVKAKTMVFMVQKEVADRMRAAPGGKDYGALSVAVQYYSKPEIIMEVPPNSFIPAPEVCSSVIRLELYDEPPVDIHSEELFFKLVKAAFGQRRKTLVNAINNAGYFGLGKEEIKEILDKAGIGEKQRGETLSLEQFALLSNLIYKN